VSECAPPLNAVLVHVPGKRSITDIWEYVPRIENENQKEMLQEIPIADAQRYSTYIIIYNVC